MGEASILRAAKTTAASMALVADASSVPAASSDSDVTAGDLIGRRAAGPRAQPATGSLFRIRLVVEQCAGLIAFQIIELARAQRPHERCKAQKA